AFFFYCHATHRDPPSSPTRRSSDLLRFHASLSAADLAARGASRSGREGKQRDGTGDDRHHDRRGESRSPRQALAPLRSRAALACPEATGLHAVAARVHVAPAANAPGGAVEEEPTAALVRTPTQARARIGHRDERRQESGREAGPAGPRRDEPRTAQPVHGPAEEPIAAALVGEGLTAHEIA